MLRPIMFAMTLGAASTSIAQVYKCEERGRTVFSDRPCIADALPHEVRPAAGAYKPDDGQRARDRSAKEQARILRIEAERAAQARLRMQEAELRKEKAEARCEEIARNRARAQARSVSSSEGEAGKRAAQAAHHWKQRDFFECNRG